MSSDERQDRSSMVMDFSWFDIETDPVGWNVLSGSGDGFLFSTSEVLRVHCYGGKRPAGVVAKAGGAVLLGGLRSGDGKVFETLGFPQLEHTLAPGLVDELREWLGRQGVEQVRLGSYNGGVDGYSRDFPAQEVRRLEFVWDLGGTEQEREAGMRSNHKRKLKKSASMGYRLSEIVSHRAFVLTRLRWIWEQRKGAGFGLRRILSSWSYHNRLMACLGESGIGRLYGYYGQDGDILSVAYMLEYGDTAFYMLGASSSAGYQHGASIVFFRDLSRMYAGRGVRFLNLGGVPAEAAEEWHEENGVYRFKRGFGLEPEVRTGLIFEVGRG